MKPYPMKRIQFDRPQLPVTEFDSTSNLIKISIQVADIADNAIVDAILQAAKEENLTDLYLIDRKFILRAMRNELERKRGKWVVTECDSGEPEGYPAFIEFHCPFCNEPYSLESGEYDWYYGDTIPLKFCHECGADMREA